MVIRDHIVAACTLKTVLQIVRDYKGKPDRFQTYLLKELAKLNTDADTKLAEAGRELLQ